jgi:radical SAM protein with 4Fe4S-binding SPASM domain
MYVKLNSEYVLRGWKGIPYGLVNTKTGSVEFLDAETFHLFEWLDGEINLDLVLMTPGQKQFLAGLLEASAESPPQAAAFDQPRPVEAIQRYRKSKGAYIQCVHWSITGGCNLKCRHCYMSAPRHKYRESGTEQCLALIRQMAEANVAGVTITGGEPLLRKDFWQLSDALSDAGIPILQLYTNGILIDDAFFENMKKRNLNFEFVLSFDCVDRHDWLRGIPGIEERTIAAIRSIRQKGYAVSIETALHSGNIDKLLPTYNLMKELGIGHWKTARIFDAGEWKDTSFKTLPPETLYGEYTALLKKYIADGQPLSLQLDGFFAGSKGGGYGIPYIRPQAGTELPAELRAEGLEKHSCLSCRVHPYILPDGRLLPCPAYTGTAPEAELPNLYDAGTSIADVYANSDGAFMRLVNIRSTEVIAHNESCVECEHRFECGGGCRACAVIDGNGVLGRDNARCHYFKEGFRHCLDDLSVQNSSGL